MEQIKHNHSLGANFEARTVKDIIKPAESILNKVSVKVALDEMQARAMDSSPVIDQRGELLGTVSQNKMNREVGGFGHDPKTEPVEAHIDKNNPYCFEDQTIAEAEQMMLDAKVGKVPVVTREKLLVGTINIEAIAEEKRGGKSPLGASEKSASQEHHNPVRSSVLTVGHSYRASQLWKRVAKLRGRATDNSPERAIEVRHRLKSAE